MELRHLRYFIVAAEEEHFGRAADRLCVTRSAVSQSIADLEMQFGTQLFQRFAHQVRLTPAGRALLPQLKAVMKQLDDALAMAKRIGQGKIGSLNIGYGSLTLMHSIFRATIKEFHELYPDVNLSLFDMSTTEQLRALGEGRIDAAFIHFGPGGALFRSDRRGTTEVQEEVELEWIRIQDGGLGVAVPSDHPIAQRESVTIAELAQEQFIVVPRSTTNPEHGPVRFLFKAAAFEPKIIQEVDGTATQLNLISVGMGVGLIVTGPHFVYPSGVSVVPVADVDYTTSFIFGWNKRRKDPAVERMTDIIRALSD